MTAAATNIPETKRFLVALAGALRDPYRRARPYLILDNHSPHHSSHVRDELSRFHVCFYPAYLSAANCQETVWSQLKREYFVRLHRRDRDLTSDDEFRAMIRQLCEDVPINAANILRANHAWIAKYLELAAEQSAASF